MGATKTVQVRLSEYMHILQITVDDMLVVFSSMLNKKRG